jgi:hypothetical protein
MSRRATSTAQHWLDRPILQSGDGDWEFCPSHAAPPVTDTELQRLERDALFAVLAEHFQGSRDAGLDRSRISEVSFARSSLASSLQHKLACASTSLFMSVRKRAPGA